MTAFVALLFFNIGWLASRLAGHISRARKSGMTIREAITPNGGRTHTSKVPKITEVP